MCSKNSIDVRVLLLLLVSIFVGLKIGVEISATGGTQTDATGAYERTQNSLKEAHSLFEEGLLSEEEYALFRQQLLGLPLSVGDSKRNDRDDNDSNDEVQVEKKGGVAPGKAANEAPSKKANREQQQQQQSNEDQNRQTKKDIVAPAVSGNEKGVSEKKPLPPRIAEAVARAHEKEEKQRFVELVPQSRSVDSANKQGGTQKDQAVLRLEEERRDEANKKLADALQPSLLNRPLPAVDSRSFDSVGQSVNSPDSSYPTVKGVAYSADKHKFQGGSKLVSSCPDQEATHKIVFIKTHKTGSSTITNLFHRFGYKYGLFVLPYVFIVPFTTELSFTIFYYFLPT